MKGYKIYLIIGAILIGLYLIAQYNKPAPTDWSGSYLPKDKIPFGTYILRHRISDIMPNAEIKTASNATYGTFKNSNYKNSSYLIVAPTIKIDKTDFEQLKLYMEAGNNVFIASYSFGNFLTKKLKLQTATVFKTSPASISVNFTNPALKTDADYRFERDIGNQYFRRFDTTNVTILGKNAFDNANFIKYSYKKGALYLIAEPSYYTNFNLLDKDGAEYAAKTLSYLQNSKTLIFDEFNTVGQTGDKSIMRLFFKNPELKYAYYLTIISLLLFVVYDMKRRQRIIPINDPFANSTLDFIDVIGNLYYNERNNIDLAKKKIIYFLEHLRSKYYLKTNEIDVNFSDVLMQKTGIDETLAKKLTTYFMQMPSATKITDMQLINLNESIEQFYKNTQTNGASI